MPSLDLDFVAGLVAELTTHPFPTGSATVSAVTADPALVDAAGFSNGGGLVWQLLNSDLSTAFRGFAAVGKALEPEKSRHYRGQLAPAGWSPGRPRSATCRGPRIAASDRRSRWRRRSSTTRRPTSR